MSTGLWNDECRMKIDELRHFVVLGQVIQFEHSKRMMNSTFFEFINIQSTIFNNFCYIEFQ